jgi:hypothetical protein
MLRDGWIVRQGPNQFFDLPLPAASSVKKNTILAKALNQLALLGRQDPKDLTEAQLQKTWDTEGKKAIEGTKVMLYRSNYETVLPMLNRAPDVIFLPPSLKNAANDSKIPVHPAEIVALGEFKLKTTAELKVQLIGNLIAVLLVSQIDHERACHVRPLILPLRYVVVRRIQRGRIYMESAEARKRSFS